MARVESITAIPSTSAGLAAIITDETGTAGNLVFSTSPTLTTPVIASIVNTGTQTVPTVTGTLMSYSTTSIASDTTPDPTGDAKLNEYYLTALAGTAAFNAPSGSLTNGNMLRIRIKDNGTARIMSWDAIYIASPDLPLPLTTVLGKTMYLMFVYNSTTPGWNLIGLINNF